MRLRLLGRLVFVGFFLHSLLTVTLSALLVLLGLSGLRLVISESELARRAVFWDQFLVRYPDFIYFERMAGHWEMYRMALIGGLDNTPSFDFAPPHKLFQGYKKAYEWILENHADTRTGKEIKDWYMLLKQHNWELSEEVKARLENLR